jgi:hypothetical protein
VASAAGWRLVQCVRSQRLLDVADTIFHQRQRRAVTCQWARDGEDLPTSTVTAASGQQQVRVGIKWNLRGRGDLSRRSGLPVLHARRDLSPVRLFYR